MEHLKRILARQANGEFPHSSQITNKKDIAESKNQSTSIIKKNDDNIQCEICQDRGLIIGSDDIARPCACMKQKALINRFKSAQISKETMNCTFKNFRAHYYSKQFFDPTGKISSYETAEKAFQGARKFVKDFIRGENPDGLMFSGSVGCGKTFLAGAIANALLEQGIEVLFIVVPDLLDEIKATYGYQENSNTEHSLLETARKVPLLILDDLGAHNYTDWVRNKIYSIINYRLNNNLSTVITTNLDLNELKEFLGERTTSRIIQMCQLYLILVEEDIRIVKRKEKKT